MRFNAFQDKRALLRDQDVKSYKKKLLLFRSFFGGLIGSRYELRMLEKKFLGLLILPKKDTVDLSNEGVSV